MPDIPQSQRIVFVYYSLCDLKRLHQHSWTRFLFLTISLSILSL